MTDLDQKYRAAMKEQTDLRGMKDYFEYLEGRGVLTAAQREEALVASVRSLHDAVEKMKGAAQAYASVVAVRKDHVVLNNGTTVARTAFPSYLVRAPVRGDSRDRHGRGVRFSPSSPTRRRRASSSRS